MSPTKLIIVLAVLSATATLPAFAAEKAKVPAVNAVGVGSSWNADVSSSSTMVGRTFDAQDLEAIESVNAYFNGFEALQGRFIQFDAQNKKTRGKFYVKRPGRFRFVYARPSRLVILSDGQYLSIEDFDLETVDRYSIDSTPFRLLLAQKVDILNDAQVVDLQRSQEKLVIAIQDKSDSSSGRIKLFFTKSENEIVLKEWIITDVQGLDTRIEVANLEFGKEVDPDYFKGSRLGLPGVQSPR